MTFIWLHIFNSTQILSNFCPVSHELVHRLTGALTSSTLCFIRVCLCYSSRGSSPDGCHGNTSSCPKYVCKCACESSVGEAGLTTWANPKSAYVTLWIHNEQMNSEHRTSSVRLPERVCKGSMPFLTAVMLKYPKEQLKKATSTFQNVTWAFEFK